MGHGGIVREFKELGFKPSTLVVFLYVQEQTRSNEDGRTACSPRYVAEDLDLTEKVVRNAFKELSESGYIALETQSRAYTMITLCDRRKGAAKGAAKGAVKLPKIQHEFDEQGAAKGAAKGDTGVTAVRRSSGVDVNDVVLEKELGKPRATPPIVHKSKPTTAERYQAAIERAPDLPHVTMHIDRVYAELSQGHKYPWAGNPTAATMLADLIFSHGAPLVIAAAEKYFVRGHAWTEERAWAIDEFARQFAKLITLSGATKRASEVELELKTQARPSTPRELRTQLAAMRKREQEPIPDWKPEDVTFRADLEKLRAKATAGV